MPERVSQTGEFRSASELTNALKAPHDYRMVAVTTWAMFTICGVGAVFEYTQCHPRNGCNLYIGYTVCTAGFLIVNLLLHFDTAYRIKRATPIWAERRAYMIWVRCALLVTFVLATSGTYRVAQSGFVWTHPNTFYELYRSLIPFAAALALALMVARPRVVSGEKHGGLFFVRTFLAVFFVNSVPGYWFTVSYLFERFAPQADATFLVTLVTVISTVIVLGAAVFTIAHDTDSSDEDRLAHAGRSAAAWAWLWNTAVGVFLFVNLFASTSLDDSNAPHVLDVIVRLFIAVYCSAVVVIPYFSKLSYSITRGILKASKLRGVVLFTCHAVLFFLSAAAILTLASYFLLQEFHPYLAYVVTAALTLVSLRANLRPLHIEAIRWNLNESGVEDAPELSSDDEPPAPVQTSTTTVVPSVQVQTPTTPDEPSVPVQTPTTTVVPPAPAALSTKRLGDIRRRNRTKAATIPGQKPPQYVFDALRSGVCVYCGSRASHADHIRPLSRGGWHHVLNLVPACEWCNSNKSNLLLVEWMETSPSRVMRGCLASPLVMAEYVHEVRLKNGRSIHTHLLPPPQVWDEMVEVSASKEKANQILGIQKSKSKNRLEEPTVQMLTDWNFTHLHDHVQQVKELSSLVDVDGLAEFSAEVSRPFDEVVLSVSEPTV